MSHPRYWPAVGWTFLAAVISAICAIPVIMIVSIPLMGALGLGISGSATAGGAIGGLIVGLVIMIIVVAITIAVVEAFFLRMFYRSKLGISVGLLETMITLIVIGLIASLAGGVVGVIFPPFIPVISFAIGLLGTPWWFLRKYAGEVMAAPAVAAPGGTEDAFGAAPGGADTAWATWTFEAVALCGRIEAAAAQAQADGNWQPLVGLRGESQQALQSAPAMPIAAQVDGRIREVAAALKSVAVAGSAEDMGIAGAAIGAARPQWIADEALRAFVANNRAR